jgi:hypothetical protein
MAKIQQRIPERIFLQNRKPDAARGAIHLFGRLQIEASHAQEVHRPVSVYVLQLEEVSLVNEFEKDIDGFFASFQAGLFWRFLTLLSQYSAMATSCRGVLLLVYWARIRNIFMFSYLLRNFRIASASSSSEASKKVISSWLLFLNKPI